MKRTVPLIILVLILFAIGVVVWSNQRKSSQQEMIRLLAEAKKRYQSPACTFYPEAKLRYYDSLIAKGGTESELMMLNYHKTESLMRLGEEEQIIEIMDHFIKKNEKESPATTRFATATLALAYLRLGERANCITGHVSESCIMPIRGLGVHKDRYSTERAKEVYLAIVEKHPEDLESRWLLNIACMTLGEYPQGVPKAFLIPGLDVDADTTVHVKAFLDIATTLGLNVKNMGGGTIVDDFDNDGYLDIVTSAWGLDEAMHYFRNNADGTFADLSAKSKLGELTGGLNISQADYNNDGFLDILVLRGAWKNQFGNEPNSLLKNNGDGTFTDVTTRCGLLSFHPTQTATWNDFDNDGWLDLFIGNESIVRGKQHHPCELYHNNQDGTFTDIAKKAGCDLMAYVKGVTSGDYDHDGRQDIFISTLDGNKILLKNKTADKGEITFEDVTQAAGLDKAMGKTFPTWFWDYNNDGWLDILVSGYDYTGSLAFSIAAEALNIPGKSDKMFLFRNNHDGTFTNVAKEAGLDKYVFAMGSNFGDIDNDGFLDMYFGTGNPVLTSIIPNKMYKNVGGERFADVTASARVGHLQKGHGVSFADIDNDGDQDIYTDLGGAYKGDVYENSFFLNPGQGNNNWIAITLEGKESNRSAIGSRVRLSFREHGKVRNVYRDVNSGGSFGSSPLRREIGIGQAAMIDEVEIKWSGTGKTQVFRNLQPNQFVKITEGNETVQIAALKVLDFENRPKTISLKREQR